MIKSIIVEDDPKYSDNLIIFLKKIDPSIDILSVSRNVDDALIAIEKFNPELIFLDIELEGGETGFDLLKNANKINFDVIFTTAHIDKNINEIRACGIGFIVKPYILQELKDAINKYLDRRNPKIRFGQLQSLKTNLLSEKNEDKIIWISNMNIYTAVDTKNIIYCKSSDPLTHFFLIDAIDNNKMLTSSKSIGEWEKDLENTNIVRIHNEYMVNIKHIKKYYKVKNGNLEMKMKLDDNIKSLPVSKDKKDNLLYRLGIKKISS